MKCFVINGKHIFFATTLILSVSVIGITINIFTKRAVTAFENKDFVSEVMPSEEKPVWMKKIERFIDGEINSDGKNLLNKFSPMFEKKTPEPVPENSPEPQTSELAQIIPKTESKCINVNIAKIQNATEYQIIVSDYKEEPYTFPENGKVLIVHTHTTESYASESVSSIPDNSRNIDETQNVIAIGEVFRTVLEENGISVVHDKTFHDYPSYQGAYTRSLNTIKRNLSENPEIAAVLDIHRDAIIKKDGTRIRFATNINGEECAQLMVVCGTDSMGLSHPEWKTNLNFGIKLTEKTESIAPGLMRPLNLREERFNQHLTTGSIIIEVGTNGNTLTEAKNGARIFAEAVSDVINEAKKH